MLIVSHGLQTSSHLIAHLKSIACLMSMICPAQCFPCDAPPRQMACLHPALRSWVWGVIWEDRLCLLWGLLSSLELSTRTAACVRAAASGQGLSQLFLRRAGQPPGRPLPRRAHLWQAAGPYGGGGTPGVGRELPPSFFPKGPGREGAPG